MSSYRLLSSVVYDYKIINGITMTALPNLKIALQNFNLCFFYLEKCN